MNKTIKTNLRYITIDNSGKVGRPRQYPWMELKIGETFSVYKDTGNIYSVVTNLSNTGKRWKRNFVVSGQDYRRVVIERLA